jgi:hypothetical protein
MSDFTVVGAFSSIAQAENALVELQDLFRDIKHHRTDSRYQAGYTTIPTWPEAEISAKYGIEWDESLDWIDSVERQVTQFLNFVFITTDSIDTYQYPNTIVALFKKMASQVFVAGRYLNEELIILTKMNCIAPEEQAAAKIASEFNLYLQSKDVEFLIPPWEIYSPTLELWDLDLLKKPLDGEFDQTRIQQAVDALYRYQKAKIEGRPLIRPEEEAIAALVSLQDFGYTLPYAFDGDLLSKLIHSIGGVSDTSARGMEVKTEGTSIHIPEVFFIWPEKGIPAIYKYLENEACTDIEFSLTSVPYASKPEYI